MPPKPPAIILGCILSFIFYNTPLFGIRPSLFSQSSLCSLICFFSCSLSFSGSNESMSIVHALLEVASHPEYDIASMTYNFWHSLQVNLTKRYICYIKLFNLPLCYCGWNRNTFMTCAFPGIPIFHLKKIHPLNLREIEGCTFSVQHMSHLFLWWVQISNSSS